MLVHQGDPREGLRIEVGQNRAEDGATVGPGFLQHLSGAGGGRISSSPEGAANLRPAPTAGPRCPAPRPCGRAVRAAVMPNQSMPSAAVSRSKPSRTSTPNPALHPCPQEPPCRMNPQTASVRQAASMCPPFAVLDPFFAAHPSTMTTVPTGIEFLFHPRRIMEFGAASSMDQLLTLPFESLT